MSFCSRIANKVRSYVGVQANDMPPRSIKHMEICYCQV